VSVLCHVGGGEEGSARHDVMFRLAVSSHGRNGMVFWLQVYDKQIVRLRFGSLQCLVRLFWGRLECICYRNLCHKNNGFLDIGPVILLLLYWGNFVGMYHLFVAACGRSWV
jgi:hypothetical protein